MSAQIGEVFCVYSAQENMPTLTEETSLWLKNFTLTKKKRHFVKKRHLDKKKTSLRQKRDTLKKFNFDLLHFNLKTPIWQKELRLGIKKRHFDKKKSSLRQKSLTEDRCRGERLSNWSIRRLERNKARVKVSDCRSEELKCGGSSKWGVPVFFLS